MIDIIYLGIAYWLDRFLNVRDYEHHRLYEVQKSDSWHF